jgi:hypothetical protein
MIFNHLLVRSQQGSIFRENIKSEVIKVLTMMRKLLIELGKRLAASGVLENAGYLSTTTRDYPSGSGKVDFDIAGSSPLGG